MKKTAVLDPAQDGVTHVRIHQLARTKLGRLLASCALTPIIVPGWGAWNSIDALRVGLGTGQLRRAVRELALERAEREAFYLAPESVAELNRQADVVQLALECKLDQTKLCDGTTLREELVKNKLPFAHYIVIAGEAVEEELPAYLNDFLRNTTSSTKRVAKKRTVRCTRTTQSAKVALAR
jgi:hypothetical protein